VEGAALRSVEATSQDDTALPSGVEAREKMTILYAPTLRGGAYSYFKVFSLGGWDFSVIDERLGELNANLIVQLHPAQAMKQSDILEIDKCRNISYANSETGLTKAKDDISVLFWNLL
jgi:hypothetical protein